MDNTAYIEAYLEGTLTQEERGIFESRLKEEPVFAADYETHLAGYTMIKANGMLLMKSKLREYEDKKYGTHRVGLIKVMLAAAVVFGMVAIFFFLLPSNQAESPDQLYAAYFNPYRDPVTVRSGAETNDLRSLANESYRAKDFKAAKSYFGQLTSPTPADKFYYGLSALQSNDMSLAISLLAEVSLGESDYQQQAAWYLSLAYIRDSRKEEAKVILHAIVRDKTYKNDRARNLLEKLE